ncbi:hypothetical protein [Nisaea sediminum]|uniref:hypothetical protein n=1 Tax=Nisaea sediminum TaxID=2775867 RepID=UPI001868EBAF|nr:hypothetical protein [Nisaea sediminum]
MRDAVGAVALLIVSSAFLAGLMLTAPVRSDQTVAAIFPPWFDKSSVLGAVSEAGGSMLRHGGTNNIALVRLERPDASERLRNAGAWAVVDPGGLFGCIGVKGGTRFPLQKDL